MIHTIQCKIACPRLTFCKVHGGAGVSGDFPLARALAGMRTLRIADGPDAVHQRTIALLEIKKAKKSMNNVRSRL